MSTAVGPAPSLDCLVHGIDSQTDSLLELPMQVRNLAGSTEGLRAEMGCRQVVERRVYTVTGKQATEQEVEQMIETGESEAIFQKAIMEQGRGHVSAPCSGGMRHASGCVMAL